MLPHPLPAPRCLNSLLRYELAAVRCYQFAETALGLDPARDVLLAIRQDHEAAAELLREQIREAGDQPSADPGLWGVMVSLVETTAVVFGRRSMLTMLSWTEKHAADTYETACRVPHLSRGSRPATRIAAIRRHVTTLEELAERHQDHAVPMVAAPAPWAAGRPAGVTQFN